MRLAFAERARWTHFGMIGADTDPRLLERELDLVFAHHEVHGRNVVAIGHCEVESCVKRVLALHLRDLRNCFAFVLLELRIEY